MAKPKKDGKFINCYVRSDIVETLDKLSKQTMMSKTAILEMALTDYFQKIKRKSK